MLSILLLILAITPPLLMTSGFIMSATGSLMLFIMSRLIVVKKFSFVSLNEILTEYKLEFLFVAWSIYSLIGKTTTKSILISSFIILSFFYFILFLRKNINNLSKYQESIYYSVLFGVIIAIVIFFIEKYTAGILSTSFRYHILKDTSFLFYLFRLDRGCAFLSVYYWVLCKALVDRKAYGIAILFYILILGLLLVSDCLAGIVAFIASGFVFILITNYKKIIPILTTLIIIGSLSFPMIFNSIDPKKVSNYVSHLPLSAKERLFIWNFVTHKIEENFWFGVGINHSRDVRVKLEKLIDYDGHIFSPFQLHPHNNILQILLELGLVGFLLSLGLLFKYLNHIHDASTYAAFVSYYIIGMISYSLWQSWWLISAVIIYCLLQILSNKHNDLYRTSIID